MAPVMSRLDYLFMQLKSHIISVPRAFRCLNRVQIILTAKSIYFIVANCKHTISMHVINGILWNMKLSCGRVSGMLLNTESHPPHGKPVLI